MPHQPPVFLLACVLLRFNSSLCYSLKNCTVDSSGGADVSVECTDRELDAVPDDIPETAISLRLTTNNIRSVRATDFRGLSKLRYLEMQLNSLARVDGGAFADLVELTELVLSYNDLANLTDGVFQGLSALESLDLFNNQLAYVSPRAFEPLVSLQKVQLTRNNLHMTDIVPVLQLPNLLDLAAGQNRLTSFESDHLTINRSNLRRLDLNLNPLRKFSLTRDVFPRLQYLDLSLCSSGFEWDVPDAAFLKSVTEFCLAGTEISFESYRAMLRSVESVEKLWLFSVTAWFQSGLMDAACQIPALTSLFLSSNDIVLLNDTLLRSCSGLTELSLPGNVMTDLTENSLAPLNQLRELRLDYNFLTRVPLAVRDLSSLAVLNLGSNDIGDLGCSDFQNLTQLKQLFLGRNRISKLRGCAFQGLSSLMLLYIEGNPIIRVHDTFSTSLQNLRVLNMNGNDLKTLSKGDFGTLSSLLILDSVSLSDCKIENGTFEGLGRLQRLTLSPYSLRRDMFRGLPNLESLTVYLPTFTKFSSSRASDEPPFLNVPSLRTLTIKNNNKYAMVISPDLLQGLKDLEQFAAEKFFSETPHADTFTHTPRLTSLQIVGSNVSHPRPELFQPIPNLQRLDLSKNKMGSLDFLSRANLSALLWLTLRENELTVISESVFQSLPALTYLDLFGNPFTCDCSNVGFIQWVKENDQTQVVNAHQYTCTFPPSQQDTMLLDFDLQSCWMDVSFLCFVSSTCLTLLTLLTSFIYHFLRWQLAYAYHLFLAFLYDSRKRKKGAAHRYDAFVSYNVHDEDWVCREMLPALEGEQGWRLCLHHRDFQPGKPIIENITDAIYGSRKTICVITRRYLQSEWCSREIQMASFRLFDEQKDVLVLLFLEDIPAHQLSPYYRMRKLVKRRSYLSWTQAGTHTGVFWQNVGRALETGDAPDETTDLLGPGRAPEYGT